VRTAIRAQARETASTVYRDAILGAAREEFTLRGYASTKMVDVARRAGMSVGALYRHFENKEAIFISLMDDASEELLERLRGIAGAADDPRTRLAEMIGIVLSFIEENRGMFLVFNQLGDSDRATCHQLVDKSEDVRQRFAAVFHQALADGVARGIFRDDVAVEDQQNFMRGAMHGFIEAWMRSDGEGRLADKAPLIAQLTFRALGGTP
jgi:TetR/AcrR family transcriptional regulator, cholesterol catabolism regulator